MSLNSLELSKIYGGTFSSSFTNLLKLYRLIKIKILIKKLFID